jgi:hypothetical protein
MSVFVLEHGDLSGRLLERRREDRTTIAMPQNNRDDVYREAKTSCFCVAIQAYLWSTSTSKSQRRSVRKVWSEHLICAVGDSLEGTNLLKLGPERGDSTVLDR